MAVSHRKPVESQDSNKRDKRPYEEAPTPDEFHNSFRILSLGPEKKCFFKWGLLFVSGQIESIETHFSRHFFRQKFAYEWLGLCDEHWSGRRRDAGGVEGGGRRKEGGGGKKRVNRRPTR